MPESPSQIAKQISQQLDDCLSADRGRLIAGLKKVRERIAKKQPVDKDIERLSKLVESSSRQVALRREGIPKIEYPDLPVSDRRDDIAKAILENQVVVIAGETGSGKTTQLPKICLELGRGSHGLIGHTQPRRIAARTVASRIAEELHTPLGGKVGYQVRFNEQCSENTYIKLMTDGILLAEVQNDRLLNRYDTIIIDEAHERSLNIDFLLGYLKQILPKRPDLKVIITSATIDVERFSRHFDSAPVIEVSGRTYPVELRYCPPQEDEELSQSVLNALDEIQSLPQRGDVLVFLSGEREIREVALALRKAQLPHIDVLPLYARLSLAEQNKVFDSRSRRGTRVVLATNVAETSITVPGIRYVIDPGTARISRYSYRTKVQRLPIEAISQASANQRKGRCGRLSDGLCYRLYSEEDFISRTEFTDPEIVRTNLAAVILQMMHLRIGDIRNFDFVDAPDQRLISDGFQLLSELGAIDNKDRLTAVGRQLCRLPVDPRMGRMLLAAADEGSLREVLIIVSALSIQDPRERPADKQQQADQAHAQWRDKTSDFISLLNLWDHMEEQRQQLSGNQFSKYCKRNFISYLRMREWRDLHHQLHHSIRELQIKNSSARIKSDSDEDVKYNDAAIHRALLTGLLGQVATLHEGKEYLGTRNRKFMIFPGSGVYKKTPKWLMCAELIETSKLFAHTVAQIDVGWLPKLAAHMVKKNYSEPHYDTKRGEVMAFERQTLYGLTIVERKRCSYSHINPKESREVFIQSALVEGKYGEHKRAKGKFFSHNQRLLDELEDIEARVRRRDIVAEEIAIYQFFDERVPADIANFTSFETWRKQAEQNNPELLFMDRELLMQRAVSDATEAQFPDSIQWQGVSYPLSYRFEPGHPLDGVTATIPLAALHQAPRFRFEWLVPGLLRDKCISLVKTLPKPLRRNFVPVPSFVDKALPGMQPDNKPLGDALGYQLQRHTSVDLSNAGWRVDQLDSYYLMNFRLVDEEGVELAVARDLEELQIRYRDRVQKTIQRAADPGIEKSNLTRWDFGELPEIYQNDQNGLNVRAWPALIDEGESVSLKLLDHPDAARNLSWKGALKLALLQYSQPAKYLKKQLLKSTDLKLMAAGLGRREQLVEPLITSAYQQALFADRDQLPRDQQTFEALIEQGSGAIVGYANELESIVESILEPLAQIRKALKKLGLAAIHAANDVDRQLNELLKPESWADESFEVLRQYPRYIKAIQLRLEKAPLNVLKDRQFTMELEKLQSKLGSLPSESSEWSQKQQQNVVHYRFLLQEYRVSLFAQQLKTALPVSLKRIEEYWKEVGEAFS